MIKTVDINRPEVQELRLRIETKLGESLRRTVYKRLSLAIYDSTKINISESTLQRIWGYVSSSEKVNEETLDILSKYIGYDSWQSFKKEVMDSDENDSNILNQDHSISTSELQIGDILQLGWQPNRYCEIRYCGENKFEVTHSENAKLQVGDTFKCGLFIKGELLSLDEVRQYTNPHTPRIMIIAKKSGLTMLNKKEL
jgi:hypothetical protein